MKNCLSYKGYHARVEFDEEDRILTGEIFGIRDSISFHGSTIDELIERFHNSVDEYLAFCAEVGKVPEREYKGSFNVRIDPELHREAAIAAYQEGITLNQYVERAIKNAVAC